MIRIEDALGQSLLFDEGDGFARYLRERAFRRGHEDDPETEFDERDGKEQEVPVPAGKRAEAARVDELHREHELGRDEERAVSSSRTREKEQGDEERRVRSPPEGSPRRARAAIRRGAIATAISHSTE